MENAIKKKLEEIAECICNKIQNEKIINMGGLYDGEFGILLFLVHYSRFSNNPKVHSLTEKFAEDLLEKLGTDIKKYSFCGGLAGILYLFEFFKERKFIEIDVDNVENVFDNFLIHAEKRDIKRGYYDFLHGALGVGFYFLKKSRNQQPIIDLIDFLFETAEKDTISMALKWKSILNENGEIGYNISLSHGISSIILFISRAIKLDVKHDKLLLLLEGAVNYVLSQQIDCSKYGSFFPSQSLENNNFLLYKSRLGWCYGDLSVSFAIWYAGKIVNRNDWMKKGMNILLQSTKRSSLIEKSVVDAGICHGSVGIAMIYRRMYLETANVVFLDAANDWVMQTLNYANFPDGLAGFKTKVGEKWNRDYILLTGITGIGLMFMSYLLNDKQDWDEMFLLS